MPQIQGKLFRGRNMMPQIQGTPLHTMQNYAPDSGQTFPRSEYDASDSGHAIAYRAKLCPRFQAGYSDLGMMCLDFGAAYTQVGMLVLTFM